MLVLKIALSFAALHKSDAPTWSRDVMVKDEAAPFGRLVRRFRLAAGLTQEALAEHAGLSVRGIADLERGARRAPYPETIERLARALGLSEANSAAPSRQAPSRLTGKRRSDAAGELTGVPHQLCRA